jgi:hypothetical protein
MLEVIALSTSILLLITIIGAPVSILALCGKHSDKPIEFPILLAVALTSGFGISAFAASVSYSFLGINRYFHSFLFIGILLWIVLLFSRDKLQFKFTRVKGYPLFLLFSFTLAIFFAKSQWDSNLKPRIFSGIGPDVSQNLLAASIAPSLGDTWFDASNRLITSLGVSNLDEAAIRMFEIPSFVHLAGYDYLVFGNRWGLTVPFSQIIRIFGPHFSMFEIGSVLVATLFTILVISFSFFRIARKSHTYAVPGSLALSLNGSFLNQYFNGGISQALGLIGNFGVLLTLLLLIVNKDLITSKRQKIGLFFVSTLSWTSSAISYVDASFVLGIFMAFFAFILLISHRQETLRILNFVILPGIFTLLINPVFTYSIWSNLDFRINANLGTGVNTGNWRIPTQNIGLLSTYSQFTENSSSLLFYASVTLLLLLILITILVLFCRPRIKSIFSKMLLICVSLVIIGFLLAVSSRNSSDYVYNKITTFLAPFILISFLLLLSIKSEKKFKQLEISTIWLLSLVIFISAISVENSYSKGRDYATIIPHQYSELLKNSEIQKYFQESNYVLPYKPAYNFVGLFGVHYWVSKAPNDMDYNIDSRLDKPLKLFCFTGENICNPRGKKILGSSTTYLERFGIVEFESTLSTRDYFSLPIIDRYNYAFDEMGTERQTIPEKYIGGNPYLK